MQSFLLLMLCDVWHLCAGDILMHCWTLPPHHAVTLLSSAPGGSPAAAGFFPQLFQSCLLLLL
jgi:hypothetical protein